MKRLFFSLASLSVLAPAAAWAQAAEPSVTVPNPSTQPVLLESDGATVVARDPSLNLANSLFSYEDCIQDRQLRYQLNVVNTDEAVPLQVWASQGQDCSDVATRGSPNFECWLATPDAVPNTSIATVRVRLQDLVAQNTGTSRAGDYVAGTAEQCVGLNNVPFSLQFLFVRGSNAIGTSAQAAVTVDTVGPTPPSGVVAITTGTDTYVSWDEQRTPDVARYAVYCDAATDAAACASATLREGEQPPASVRPCGTVTANEIQAQLEDRSEVGAVYAVSAIDNVGNPGPLSRLSCAEQGTSLATAGTGLAGGGCSTGAGPLGASSAALAGVTALLARRRRRQAA